MQRNNDRSKSGRTLIPTKRYQSYIEESNNSGRPNKKSKSDVEVAVHNEDKDTSSSSNDRLLGLESHHGNLPHTKGKMGNMRSYTCQHCNVSMICSSSQDFIKVHHLQDGNKECYDKGLHHCPNKDCKKKFS